MAYLALKLKQARDFPVGCKIVLLPEKRFYVPGEYVEGKLIVSHRKESMNLRGIKVALQGSAFAKFKEREQIHHKTDTFLDENLYVYGAPHAPATGGMVRSVKVRLPPGTHSYPFQFQIPLSPQLPSTFKSSVGLVIYQVLAILDVDTQLLKKGEKTIDVRGALEIGPEPPIEFEKIERSCGGGGSDPCLKYSFKVSTSGFVIGRDIEFEMRADNCKFETKKGIVSLVLKTTYYGGTVSRAWKDMYTVVSETVNNDMGDSWIGALPVGKHLSASFTGGVIEFRYILRVSLEAKDGTSAFRFEKPVKIGTSLEGEPNSLDDKLSGLTLAEFRGAATSGTHAGGGRRSPDLESMDGRPGTSASLPSYSTLSLRRGSDETLPPEYDEVQQQSSK